MSSSPFSESGKVLCEPSLLRRILSYEEPYYGDFINDLNEKKRIMEAHVRTLVKLFEHSINGLAAAGYIQHVPVSSRIKTTESALGSLERREDGRMRRLTLKERLEDQTRDWKQYWQAVGKEYRIDDIGPFQSSADMLDALHDIGGIRICVYFPEDVERVVKFIKDLGREDGQDLFECDPVVVEWGPGVDPDDNLEEHIRTLEHGTGKGSKESLPSRPTPRPFGGYRATHARVQLKPSRVEWLSEHSGSTPKNLGKFVVEIQIATVVMHAWSQVEQDIIYKPKQPLFSEGQKNILDVFNGIVLIGESSLKQLGILQAEERERLAKTQENRAEDRDVLSSWIWGACKELSSEIKDPRTDSCPSTRAWAHLDKLLAILRSSDHHSYKEISHLVQSTIKKHGPQIVTCDITLDLLKMLAEETNQTIDPPEQDPRSSGKALPNTTMMYREVRSLALQVVEVLNMAIYLGVDVEYVELARKALRPRCSEHGTPSFLEMLELLHPDRPRLCTDSYFKIIEFCTKFLELDMADATTDDRKRLRLQLPQLLVRGGYTAQPVVRNVSKVRRGTAVPRDLCAFLDDPKNTHWIPEILCLGKEMAEKRNNLQEPLHIGQVFSLRSTACHGRHRGSATEQIPVMTERFLHLLLPETSRMSFELEQRDGRVFSITVDNKKVPMCWSVEQDNLPLLHVDKNSPRPRPHPGYFSAISNDASGNTASSSMPSNGWLYNEAHASNWKVRFRRFSSIDDTDISTVKERGNPFLDLAKCLNSAYGSVNLVDGHYDILIQGVRFQLSSTTNEYLFREDIETEGSSSSR